MNGDRPDHLEPENPHDAHPPHSDEAEQGVLGCLLFDPTQAGELLRQCDEFFGEEQPFYNLGNAAIYESLKYVWFSTGALDLILLQSEMRSRGTLDQVGNGAGLAYLMELPGKVPSAANLSHYLAIMWEKFVARRYLQKNAATTELILRFDGVSESHLGAIEAEHERWRGLLSRGAVSPKNLCEPNLFGDPYYDAWFNRKEDTYGWALPFEFPLRIRPGELTLFSGDSGSGKSSMLSLITLNCLRQMAPGEKAVVASMEMPPEITLWIMARQLLGVGKLECTEGNIQRIIKALAWLNERVLLYNFLGIADWRELLNTFRYAKEHCQAKLFIGDSLMRMGIEEDDYAMQAQVAAQFADFTLKGKQVHMFLVGHENKGDGSNKNKVAGSKKLTDNANNCVTMKRNEDKAQKREEWKQELAAGALTQLEYDDKIEGGRKIWDSKFILNKQRWPGSQQNGSRWLYFHHDALQFHEKPGQRGIDYLHMGQAKTAEMF